MDTIKRCGTKILVLSLLALPAVAQYWSIPKGIIQDGEGCETPCLVSIDENQTGLFYSALDSGVVRLFLSLTTNSGSTWQSPRRLVESAGDAFQPTATVSGSFIYLAWIEQLPDGTSRIFFSRSSDRGQNWSQPVPISARCLGAESVDLAGSGASVYLVWTDRRSSPTILLSSSSNRGETWTAPRLVLPVKKGALLHPVIEARNANLFLAWEDWSTGLPDVRVSRSNDQGSTWLQETRMSTAQRPATQPRMASTDSRIHLVWEERLKDQRLVRYTYTSLSGTSWFSRNLTLSQDNLGQPTVTALGLKALVTCTQPTAGGQDLYIIESGDQGGTWSTPVQSFAGSTGWSGLASSALSPSHRYVAWWNSDSDPTNLLLSQNPPPEIQEVVFWHLY